MIYLYSNNLLSVHLFDKHDLFVMSKFHSTGLFHLCRQILTFMLYM